MNKKYAILGLALCSSSNVWRCCSPLRCSSKIASLWCSPFLCSSSSVWRCCWSLRWASIKPKILSAIALSWAASVNVVAVDDPSSLAGVVARDASSRRTIFRTMIAGVGERHWRSWVSLHNHRCVPVSVSAYLRDYFFRILRND